MFFTLQFLSHNNNFTIITKITANSLLCNVYCLLLSNTDQNSFQISRTETTLKRYLTYSRPTYRNRLQRSDLFIISKVCWKVKKYFHKYFHKYFLFFRPGTHKYMGIYNPDAFRAFTLHYSLGINTLVTTRLQRYWWYTLDAFLHVFS